MRFLALLLSFFTTHASDVKNTSQNTSMKAEKCYEMLATLHARLSDGDSPQDFEEQIPKLAANLGIACEVSDKYWADSTLTDENAKQSILSEKVLSALRIRQSTNKGIEHVPAGVMHTYGYLFSQLRSPYGLKGKRWIESRLDERLDLPAHSFGPFTKEGEFLTNLTFVLSRIVPNFPQPELKHVAPSLKRALSKKSTAYLGLVTEEIDWIMPNRTIKRGWVRTHLVQLKPLADLSTSETALLIYEIELDGMRRFVTVFPIEQSYADAFIQTKPTSGNFFKPKFNLYIDPTWVVSSYKNFGFM